MKIIKLFIVSIIFIYTSHTATAQTVPMAPLGVSMATTIKTSAVKVKGVTCKNDLLSISEVVEKLKGVSACTAEKAGPTTTFQIKFDTALVTEKEIFAAIMNTPGCEDPKDRPYKIKQ